MSICWWNAKRRKKDGNHHHHHLATLKPSCFREERWKREGDEEVEGEERKRKRWRKRKRRWRIKRSMRRRRRWGGGGSSWAVAELPEEVNECNKAFVHHSGESVGVESSQWERCGCENTPILSWCDVHICSDCWILNKTLPGRVTPESHLTLFTFVFYK